MYIIYLYNSSNEVIAQVEEILDLNINLKLNNIWSGSFWLYHNSQYCKREYLKKFKKIKIVLQENFDEKVMFEWVIRWFWIDLEKTTIQFSSFEYLFDRRLIYSDKTYTTQSIDYILSDILDDINTRYNTGISLDCDITTTTSKTYKKWQSFYSIIKDLALNGYEYIINDWVLVFKESIWTDRTSWDEFVEYKYNIDEPDDRSINSLSVIEDWKGLSNGIIWKSWSNYSEQTDITSISENWLIESSITNNWDIITGVSSFLETHKDWIVEYSLGIVSNDFFEVGIWDLVKVYIYVWNDMMFFDWEMEIVEKKYKSWDLPTINFKLNITKAQDKDIIDEVKEIQERLKIIELQ